MKTPNRGKIITSGTVIFGSKTNFDEILEPGDLISVEINERTEIREINMVLGPKSISIKTPFSTDLTEKTVFKYQK